MQTLAEKYPEPLFFGSVIHEEENGLRYRVVYANADFGPEIGRLMEQAPDSRQQPKSLAFKLREELNDRESDAAAVRRFGTQVS